MDLGMSSNQSFMVWRLECFATDIRLNEFRSE